jgi:hypothetical protein
MKATMPGTVHGNLERLGKLADTHRDRNELDAQWVDRLDWELYREFDASPADCARARQQLVFDSIDTVATVHLNGKKVGRSANMFRPTVCNVRGALRPGKNELRVVIASPTRHAAAEAERHGYRVRTAEKFRWQTGESRDTYRAWIRKAQCHFGALPAYQRTVGRRTPRMLRRSAHCFGRHAPNPPRAGRIAHPRRARRQRTPRGAGSHRRVGRDPLRRARSRRSRATREGREHGARSPAGFEAGALVAEWADLG